MCGIAGLIDSRLGKGALLAQGKAMMQALVHRGPDGSGIWQHAKSGTVFGHRRLAIQDLSDAGKQPMQSRSGRYVITYNGEIYNFRELGKDLEKAGHSFVGHSDTEVLLAAIEEWGLRGTLKSVIGMFAFALWDEERRTVCLCRDRMGEKPLYYGWLGKKFVFASELKALKGVQDSKALNLNRVAVAEYMKFGYVPAPHSIYDGIFKLPPASFLTIPVRNGVNRSGFNENVNRGGFCPEAYWSVEAAANAGLANPICDEREALERLDSLLKTTVQRQLISDVKLGAFLSGGIDSSLVSAIAQSQSASGINTYSIGFDEAEYDESKYAMQVARHLGTNHSTLQADPGTALAVVEKLPAIYDEPFADSSQIPTYIVSKLAREHVTVCLSGDGGDELFGGYNRYLWMNRFWDKAKWLPTPLRRVIGAAAGFPGTDVWDNLYRCFPGQDMSNRSRQRLVGLKVQKISELLSRTSAEAGYEYLLSCWDRPEELLDIGGFDNSQINTAAEFDTFLNWAMYVDQTGYLPGDNLVKVDRASMACSLETRLPLLSHEVVEFSWRMPMSMKIRGIESKWALRKMLDNYVPRRLIDRPKMGFSVPVAAWLREDLRDWGSALVTNVSTLSGGFVRKDIADSYWREHQSGKRDHSSKLWSILMLAAWMEE